MQRTQTAEAGPGEVEVEVGPRQLGGDENAESHTNDAPNHRHNGELTNHPVVVGGTGCCVHVWASIHGYGRAADNRGAAGMSRPRTPRIAARGKHEQRAIWVY